MSNLSKTPFADHFRAGLPLPSALDPLFEEALRHVLDNPGSLIRPRMVLLVATAYGLDAARRAIWPSRWSTFTPPR